MSDTPLLSTQISTTTPYTRKCMTRNGKPRYYTVIFGADGNPKIPSFSNVQVSTMTIICYTNLIINTDRFFKYIPVTDYIIVKKKRGRKKKIQPEDPNKDISSGSVISLTKKRCVRGVVLKPKKRKSKTFFRHSVSVVMILEEGKMLNVKVSRSGKLQMTGCKTMRHAIEFVKYIYSLMIESEEWTGETLFTYKNDNSSNDDIEEETNTECPDNPQDLEETEPVLNRCENNGLNAVFRCVMCNLDFDMGFKIRRDLLNTYINRHTDFRSIFESSIGTSVNIKLKAINRNDYQLARLRITGDGECIEDLIRYDTFFNTLSTREQKFEKKKESYHTFLIFASGSVIMSSAGGEMPVIFYKLVKLLVDNRNKIEEGEDAKIIDSKWLDDGDILSVDK